jgi:hypothetical protein
MKLRMIILPVFALSALSACSSRDTNAEGTSVSINAKDKDGAVAINADGKTGKVSVNIPGFNANHKLPKMMLDHSNFDLDGVKLYPESKVRSVVVNADDTGGHDKAKVRISFDSPADTAKVRAWFKSGFDDEEVKFTETPTGFTRTTGDGDSFVVTLTPNGAAATSGTIDLDG